MRRTGRIYYGEKFVIIQVDDDATATVSEMSWNDKGVTLTAVEKWLSWEDALLDLNRREANYEMDLAQCAGLDHGTFLCPRRDTLTSCPQHNGLTSSFMVV
jgi:hypothetical protein